MSWDIALFNSKQKIELIAELDENQLEPTDFSGISESSFDQIIGTNFTIDFFTDKEHSLNFMLQLSGENALYELIELSKKHNRQI